MRRGRGQDAAGCAARRMIVSAGGRPRHRRQPGAPARSRSLRESSAPPGRGIGSLRWLERDVRVVHPGSDIVRGWVSTRCSDAVFGLPAPPAAEVDLAREHVQ